MKIKATKREVLGKKVKNLRREGVIPAAIYGPSVEPMNIAVDRKQLRELYKEVHFNKFFELEIEGEKAPYTALIKEAQIHPVQDDFYSVNFYIVDENKKIVVDVPVEQVGVAPAVKQKIGFLVQQLDTITLYCLPKDLPDHLEVDLSTLVDENSVITVSDIPLPENAELASGMDPTSAIAYIGTAQKEEAAEDSPDEEEEVELDEEGNPIEPAEGEEGEETEGEDSNEDSKE